jgi:hypothetical protein
MLEKVKKLKNIAIIAVFVILSVVNVAAWGNWGAFDMTAIRPPVAVVLVDNKTAPQQIGVWLLEQSLATREQFVLRGYIPAQPFEMMRLKSTVEKLTETRVNQVLVIDYSELMQLVGELPGLRVGAEHWNVQQVTAYLKNTTSTEALFSQAKIIQAILISYHFESEHTHTNLDNSQLVVLQKWLYHLPLGMIRLEMGD